MAHARVYDLDKRVFDAATCCRLADPLGTVTQPLTR